MREDEVHVAVRAFLKGSGWELLAGQFPGGSDDELRRFYVRDAAVARDRSPKPRHHSQSTYVPDLVARRQGLVLLVEMKPRFSMQDAEKLRVITGSRFGDLARELAVQLEIELTSPASVSCALAFSARSRFSRLKGFTYYLVHSLEKVQEITE